MKIKKILKTFVDVNLNEIVDTIFDNCEICYRDDWEDNIENIEFELTSNYKLSEEEKKNIITACEKRFYKQFNDCRNDEINELSNHDKIIKWITCCINDGWLDVGEVGYLLKPEEILDLIIKNYNKK